MNCIHFDNPDYCPRCKKNRLLNENTPKKDFVNDDVTKEDGYYSRGNVIGHKQNLK